MSDNLDRKKEQVDIAEDLQLLLLKEFQTLIKSGAMSPTDRATLARLLMQNGWTLDPSQLPRGIRDLLQKPVNPEQFRDDDADVLAFQRRA